MPEVFNVHLFERATESGVVYGSKAVGEPPLMHGVQRARGAARRPSVRSGRRAGRVDLGCPSTPEAVYWAVEAARAAGAGQRSPPEPDRRPTQGSDLDWLSAVQQLRQDGLPGVLVTVVEVRGHAPRDPGAKMVVGADHVWGSVGGGNLEETAVQRAREMIASGAVRAGDAGVAAERAREEPARQAVLRRRGRAAARAAGGAADGGGVRRRPRRLRAGPHLVAAGDPAAPGRLPPRAARPAAAGRGHRRDRRRRPCTTR